MASSDYCDECNSVSTKGDPLTAVDDPDSDNELQWVCPSCFKELTGIDS